MKLVLVAAAPDDGTTFRLVLERLVRAYRRRGHRAALVLPGPGERDERGPFARLVRALRGADAAHLHTPGRWNRLTAAVGLACDLRGVPLVVTFQDYANPHLRRDARRDAAGLRRFLAGRPVVTALSRAQARALRADFPRARVRVVPNAFAAPAPLPPPARRPRPFVLCVARLWRYKGVDALLRAWTAVPPGTDLVVCGPDHERGRYQRLTRRLGLADRVAFTGALPPRRVWALLRACELFVLPSRHEAQGIALLEAMACGKAVVATRSGGPEDLVRHGRDGVLVAPGDTRALARALTGLLADPARRRALGAAARAAARRRPDDAAAYLRLYAAARRRP
ncbi:MAG: glycosyltransferase family 4 protein [Elusimicrobiota bacterium]|nr:glycosyltransferase family 4 protein [Elusimicrobiota bacterium]